MPGLMLLPAAAVRQLWSASRPVLSVAVGAICLTFTAVSTALAASVNNDSWWIFVAAELFGLSFQLCGLVLWARSDAGLIGPLMLFGGTAWYLGNLQYSGHPVLFGIGYWLYYLAPVVFVHLVLVYPSGHLEDEGPDRFIVALAYVLYLTLQGIRYLTERDRGPIGWQESRIPSVWANAVSVLAMVLAVIVMVRLTGRRWFQSRTSRRAHRALWFVLAAMGSVLVAGTVVSVLKLDGRLETGLFLIYGLGLTCIPAAFAIGVLRERVLVADIVEIVEREPDLAHICDLLTVKLGDPHLEIGLWSPETAQFLDPRGLPVTPPPPDKARTVQEERWDDQPLAYIAYNAALDDQPRIINGVVAAIRLVLVRARQVAELRAQQRRILQAVLDERAIIAQDLHDAMQYRMYGISLLAQQITKLIQDPQPQRTEAIRLLANLRTEAIAANQALRETAQGIYPAILVERGLPAAVEEMIYRAHVPVVADLAVGRLPTAIEATAYFLIAGALANAVKHGQATSVTITGQISNGTAIIAITDDGVGGATMRPGGGLSRSADRIRALRGRLTLHSPSGGGTMITVELPCA